MKEKVCRDRSHNHDTISIVSKSSYFLSSSRRERSKMTWGKDKIRLLLILRNRSDAPFAILKVRKNPSKIEFQMSVIIIKL